MTATTTTLTYVPLISTDEIEFTAQVMPHTPGTVIFSENLTILAAVPVSAGMAVTDLALSVGTHTITALFEPTLGAVSDYGAGGQSLTYGQLFGTGAGTPTDNLTLPTDNLTLPMDNVAGVQTYGQFMGGVADFDPSSDTVTLTVVAPGTMFVFSTPVRDECPSFSLNPMDIERNPMGRRLFQHYKQRARGINIYKLADGSYTEYQPIPSIVNDVIEDPDQVVVHTYYGGYTNEVVDVEEAAALAAAGYLDNLTPI